VEKANQARETQQPMASSNDNSQNQNQMLLQAQAQQMVNQGQQQTAQQVPQLQAGNHVPLQMTGQNAQGLNPMAGNMFQRNFSLSQDTSLALNMQNYIQSQQHASAQQQRTQLQAQQQNLPQQQQQQTPLHLQQAVLLQQFIMAQANQAGLNQLNASNIYGQQQQQAGPHQAYAINLAALQRQASQNGLSNLNQPINTSMQGQEAQQTLQQRTAQFPQIPDSLKDASVFNQQVRNPLQSPAEVQMQPTLLPGDIDKMGKDIATYRFYNGLVKQHKSTDSQPHLKEQYDRAIAKFQHSRSTHPDLLNQIRIISAQHTNFLEEKSGYKLGQQGNDAFQTAQIWNVQQTNLVQQRLKQQQLANNQQIASNIAQDSGIMRNQLTPAQIHQLQQIQEQQRLEQIRRRVGGDSTTFSVGLANPVLPEEAHLDTFPIPHDSRQTLVGIGVPSDKLVSWKEVVGWVQDAYRADIINEHQYNKVKDEYFFHYSQLQASRQQVAGQQSQVQ
jgi:hypothetical protein